MVISRRSQAKFADLAAGGGTLRTIEQAYENHDFELPNDFEPSEGSMRRSVCAAAEDGIDLTDPTVTHRLLLVYLDGIEDWGRRDNAFEPPDVARDVFTDDARALVRSLQRDGAPIDDDGQLVLGSAAPVMAVERFDRLGEPQVLLDHLSRIEAGIGLDPAAAIASAKELTESALKFVLDDYGIAYSPRDSLPDLYKMVASELGLTRSAVPASVKGSQAAHKVLQNLATCVQSLAELRNELGLGHGRTVRSPALSRHARLAANAARTITEFVLETWHERKQAAA